MHCGANYRVSVQPPLCNGVHGLDPAFQTTVTRYLAVILVTVWPCRAVPPSGLRRGLIPADLAARRAGAYEAQSPNPAAIAAARRALMFARPAALSVVSATA